MQQVSYVFVINDVILMSDMIVLVVVSYLNGSVLLNCEGFVIVLLIVFNELFVVNFMGMMVSLMLFFGFFVFFFVGWNDQWFDDYLECIGKQYIRREFGYFDLFYFYGWDIVL